MTIRKNGKFKSLGVAAGTVGIFLGVQILLIVVFIFAAAFSRTPFGMLPSEIVNRYASVITMIADILTVGIIFLIFVCRRRSCIYETGIRRVKVRDALLSVGLGVLLLIFVSCVLDIIPEDSAVMQSYSDASSSISGGNVWVDIIATVLIAPIAEEIIFRGVILSRLNRAFPSGIAVIISALIFGAMHGQILWIAYAFVIGLVLGAVYIRYNSIVPTIAIHITFNLLGGIYFNFAVPTAVLIIAAVLAAAAAVVLVIKMFASGKKEYVFESELHDGELCGAPPVIEVKNLNVKARQGEPALENVELRINQGDCFGITGVAGSGKTALVNSMYGLDYFTRGSIEICGYEIREQTRQLQDNMAMLMCDRSFPPTFTPEYLFDIQASVRSKSYDWRCARRQELMHRYGLEGIEKTPVSQLDSNALKKLSLTLSVVNDPEIVFFDDNGQVTDAYMASIVKMFLNDMKSQGKTVIIATSDAGFIRQMRTRAAVMVKGCVCASGTVQALENYRYI